MINTSYAACFRFPPKLDWWDYVNGFRTVEEATASANEMHSKYPDSEVCVVKRTDEIVVDMKTLIKGSSK